MFGLFRKQATPTEVGQIIIQWAAQLIDSDAGQSLGHRFDDYDASRGWPIYLERKGISVPAQKLYARLFTHCAVHAACTQFDEHISRGIIHGATIASYANKPDGYDFDKVFATLGAIYRGEYKFDPPLAQLSNSAFQFPELPNPNAGVLNAKYLIKDFVNSRIQNSKAFIDDFQSYSATVCSPVGTVLKAIRQILKAARLS